MVRSRSALHPCSPDQAVLVADGLHRASNYVALLRGAVAELRQAPSDLPVCFAFFEEFHDQPLHLLSPGEVEERTNRGGDLEGSAQPTLPHDARLDLVGGDPAEDDLLDQAAQ